MSRLVILFGVLGLAVQTTAQPVDDAPQPLRELLGADGQAPPLPVVKAGKPVAAFRVGDADSVAARIATIAVRRIEARTGARLALVTRATNTPAIELRLLRGDTDLGPNGCRIERLPSRVAISSGDARGLGAGLGRFLRALVFAGEDVTWPGQAVEERVDPAQTMRCEQYKPGQWGNAFEDAPIEKIRGYIEDLLLWGTDCIWNACWHNLSDPFADGAAPSSQAQWRRMCELLKYAESIGLDSGYVDCVNSVYADQAHLRKLGGKLRYPEDVCPSIPQARAVLLCNRENVFRAAAESGLRLRYVLYFAHDNGGCDCPKCLPWIPTYLELVREYWQIADRYHPGVKVYLTTWMCSAAEKRDLLAYLGTHKPEWVAGVMDRPGVALPAPYRAVGWQTDFGCGPRECYGKMGADPAPGFMIGKVRAYHKQGTRGIFTYTEGIYDDINSAAIAQECRQPGSVDVGRFLEEYCRWNVGLYGDDLKRMVGLLMEHFEWRKRGPHNAAVHVKQPDRALKILDSLETRMPTWAIENWRYRILRTRIELERLDDLAHNGPDWEPAVRAALDTAATKREALDRVRTARQVIAEATEMQASLHKRCKQLTDTLYNELYGSPDRHRAHGRFTIRVQRDALAAAVDRRLAALEKADMNEDERVAGVKHLTRLLAAQSATADKRTQVLSPTTPLSMSGIELQGGGGLRVHPDLVLANAANTLCGKDGERGALSGMFIFEPGEQPLVTPLELCITGQAFGVTPYWLEISVNDTRVHSGGADFPTGTAGMVRVSVPSAAMRGGESRIALTSLEPGDTSAVLLIMQLALRVAEPGEMREPDPVAAAEPPPTHVPVARNLALKRPARASSQYDERFPPSRAVDRQPLTLRGPSENAWSCAKGQDKGCWWQVDLGAPLEIADVRVWYRHLVGLGGYGFVPATVTVQTSGNGSTWTTVLERDRRVPKERTPYRGAATVYPLPANTRARWLRLLFEDGGQNTLMPVVQLSEVEVHPPDRGAAGAGD